MAARGISATCSMPLPRLEQVCSHDRVKSVPRRESWANEMAASTATSKAGFAAWETRYGVEDHIEQKHLLTSPNLAA
jgi:hypothetical protein